MATGLWSPPLPLERDVDYVEGFQALAALGLKVRKDGPSIPLLLHKTTLELRIGSFQSAWETASGAAYLDPESAEAHWLRAVAALGLCLVRVGAISEGPGRDKPQPGRSVRDDVEAARRSLLRCVRLSQGRDEEAGALLGFIDTVLAAGSDERHMGETLRRLARP
jgi:hypothetical protein